MKPSVRRTALGLASALAIGLIGFSLGARTGVLSDWQGWASLSGPTDSADT